MESITINGRTYTVTASIDKGTEIFASVTGQRGAVFTARLLKTGLALLISSKGRVIRGRWS